jgi:hypothetical protein
MPHGAAHVAAVATTHCMLVAQHAMLPIPTYLHVPRLAPLDPLFCNLFHHPVPQPLWEPAAIAWDKAQVAPIAPYHHNPSSPLLRLTAYHCCRVKLNQDPTARAFGLQLEERPRMMEVQGRVLPTPRLGYGNHTHLDPGQKGEWNLMGKGYVWRLATVVSKCVIAVSVHRAAG